MSDVFFDLGFAPYFVAASDIRAHLNIDSSADDALLLQYAAASQRYLEGLTSRPFTQRSVTGYAYRAEQSLRLVCWPIVSWQVELVPSSGPPVNISASFRRRDSLSVAILDYDGQPAPLDPGSVWRITATAGTTDLPEPLRLALLLLVGHYYRNREDSSPVQMSSVPNGVMALIDQYRIRAIL